MGAGGGMRQRFSKYHDSICGICPASGPDGYWTAFFQWVPLVRRDPQDFQRTGYVYLFGIGQYEYCHGDEHGGGRFYCQAL